MSCHYIKIRLCRKRHLCPQACQENGLMKTPNQDQKLWINCLISAVKSTFQKGRFVCMSLYYDTSVGLLVNTARVHLGELLMMHVSKWFLVWMYSCDGCKTFRSESLSKIISHLPSLPDSNPATQRILTKLSRSGAGVADCGGDCTKLVVERAGHHRLG